MSNFDVNYSAFYNLIYKDKDYEKEAKFIYLLLKKHLGSNLNDLCGLDLACGTGRHIFELEKLKLRLDGSDISSNMISVASKSALQYDSKADFYNYSFQKCNEITKKYDYVISMFSAIDYLTTNEDLNLSLQNVHGLLHDEGLFIFDCWNGNAVTRDYSPVKVLKKSDGNKEIIRISNTQIDLLKQIATVRFNCILFNNSVKELEFDEIHPMRYFYFQEMRNILSANNFEIIGIRGFLSEEDSIDPFELRILNSMRLSRPVSPWAPASS